MATDLSGKTIVVTGGAGALGVEVVERLIANGARCHVPLFESEVPQGFHIAAHEQVAVTTGIDLSDERQVVDYYAGVGELWASLHLAGGFAMAPVADTSLADLRKMIDINAITCFLCCREAIKLMRAGGGGGRIVNVASRPAVDPIGGMVAYIGSKAMVAAMTRSLAAELVGEGIWVNAVLPSVIDTEDNRRAMPEADHASWPKPAEIARTIEFLASEDNALTSGALVPVYGRA